jgi:hypothetical protein
VGSPPKFAKTCLVCGHGALHGALHQPCCPNIRNLCQRCNLSWNLCIIILSMFLGVLEARKLVEISHTKGNKILKNIKAH